MKLLVLVDLQKDFIDGSLGSLDAQSIVPRVVEKINNYEDKRNTLVLFTKDTHYEKNYLDTLEGKMLPVPHCIENTPGWSINREIKDAVANKFLSYSSEKIKKGRVYKNTFGSDVLEKLFIEHKDEIEEIEFCGLCTDICVISNVLMARMVLPNTKITVDASCCAGVTPEKHKAALEVMKSCQIEVINE